MVAGLGREFLLGPLSFLTRNSKKGWASFKGKVSLKGIKALLEVGVLGN